MMTHNYQLDTRGMGCPLPVLRTKQAIGRLQPGEVLCVRVSDPGAVRNFEAFCRQSGNESLSCEHSDDEFVFYLRKS